MFSEIRMEFTGIMRAVRRGGMAPHCSCSPMVTEWVPDSIETAYAQHDSGRRPMVPSTSPLKSGTLQSPLDEFTVHDKLEKVPTAWSNQSHS
jgi:hypothetical protein